jgi:hypothetical protein
MQQKTAMKSAWVVIRSTGVKGNVERPMSPTEQSKLIRLLNQKVLNNLRSFVSNTALSRGNRWATLSCWNVASSYSGSEGETVVSLFPGLTVLHSMNWAFPVMMKA